MIIKLILTCLLLTGSPTIFAQSANPNWAQLSLSDQQILTPLMQDWNRYSAQKKQMFLTISTQLQSKSAKDIQKAQKRLKSWADLNPQEHDLVRQNWQKFQALSNTNQQLLLNTLKQLYDDE